MVENSLATICFNCTHWRIEGQEEIRESVGRPAEQSSPFIYGKCMALYIDSEGKEIQYNKGTFNVSYCSAIDDKGNILFESKAKPIE